MVKVSKRTPKKKVSRPFCINCDTEPEVLLPFFTNAVNMINAQMEESRTSKPRRKVIKKRVKHRPGQVVQQELEVVAPRARVRRVGGVQKRNKNHSISIPRPMRRSLLPFFKIPIKINRKLPIAVESSVSSNLGAAPVAAVASFPDPVPAPVVVPVTTPVPAPDPAPASVTTPVPAPDPAPASAPAPADEPSGNITSSASRLSTQVALPTEAPSDNIFNIVRDNIHVICSGEFEQAVPSQDVLSEQQNGESSGSDIDIFNYIGDHMK